MAFRTFSIGLTALVLSACGNSANDCGTGQAPDPSGICCDDTDGDGVGTCTSECSPPFVTDEDGVNCVCPAPTIVDPANDSACCAEDPANAGQCEPDYVNPQYIGGSAFFGWDASEGEIRSYGASSGGQAALQDPAIIFTMYTLDGTVLNVLCGVLITVDGTTAPIANTTAVDGDTVPIGLVFNAANAVVTDGVPPQLPSCNGVLDPSVWGTDIGASIVAGGQDMGFVVRGEMANSHPLYNLLETQLSDFSTAWEGNVIEGSLYTEATGIMAGSFSGSTAEIGFGRSFAVDGNFDAGDIANPTYVAADQALTTDGAFTMSTAQLPFTNAEAPMLIGL